MKACDLLTAVTGHHRAFKKAQADCVKRFKLVACTVKRIAALNAASGAHNFFELLDFLEVQPDGQAQFTQIAVGTGDSECGHVDVGVVEHLFSVSPLVIGPAADELHHSDAKNGAG